MFSWQPSSLLVASWWVHSTGRRRRTESRGTCHREWWTSWRCSRPLGTAGTRSSSSRTRSRSPAQTSAGRWEPTTGGSTCTPAAQPAHMTNAQYIIGKPKLGPVSVSFLCVLLSRLASSPVKRRCSLRTPKTKKKKKKKKKKKNWCVPYGTQRVEAEGMSKNKPRHWNESKGRRLPSKY